MKIFRFQVYVIHGFRLGGWEDLFKIGIYPTVPGCVVVGLFFLTAFEFMVGPERFRVVVLLLLACNHDQFAVCVHCDNLQVYR